MYELVLESDVIVDAYIANIPLTSAGPETEHSFQRRTRWHTLSRCPPNHEGSCMTYNESLFSSLISVSCILLTKGDRHEKYCVLMELFCLTRWLSVQSFCQRPV